MPNKCLLNIISHVPPPRLKLMLSATEEFRGLESGTSCASYRLGDLTSLDSSFPLSRPKGLS